MVGKSRRAFGDAGMILKATIFDLERNSYVDGPGIRTTVKSINNMLALGMN